MTNFITTILLLAISFFVINLFPMGKAFLGSIMDSFNEKKTNITEEYDRVKGEVEAVTKTVTETKDKVTKTVEKVGNAVDTASNALDKVNDLIGNNEVATEDAPVDNSEETTDSASSETVSQ